MAKVHFDQQFRKFAESLQSVIAGYGNHADEDFTARQRAQVEKLVKLERIFKKTLQNDCRGEFIYKKFVDFIWHSGKDNQRNTLAARPYFRERQHVFSKGISPAIQKRRHKSLYKFNINFTFIVFVLNAFPWAKRSRVRKAAHDVYIARKEIIELNMPLAISRARIFKQKTPESHLTYMDLIQISFEGLINAVDKFVLPYSPVFRSVIIGRIVGDLIENYSDTMLHFYPSDKRKIYRANKAQKHQKELSFEDLADVVNSGVKLDNPTNSSEIHHLTAAASILSINSIPNDTESTDGEDSENTLLNKHFDENDQPDVQVEQMDLMSKLSGAISELNKLEIKFLRLKGIEP